MAALEESIAAVKGRRRQGRRSRRRRKRRRKRKARRKKPPPKKRSRAKVKVLEVARWAPDRQVEVDGRELKLTNLDKVLYPKAGFTKGEVVDYYAKVGAGDGPPPERARR